MAHVHVGESRGVPCDLLVNLFAFVLNYPARWPWGTRLGREFAVGSRRANDDRLPAVACIFIFIFYFLFFCPSSCEQSAP